MCDGLLGNMTHYTLKKYGSFSLIDDGIIDQIEKAVVVSGFCVALAATGQSARVRSIGKAMALALGRRLIAWLGDVAGELALFCIGIDFIDSLPRRNIGQDRHDPQNRLQPSDQ